MRLKFVDLHKDDLWALRQEIVLNSLFTADYNNTFGFDPKSMQAFFDGYVEYLWELAEGDGKANVDFTKVVDEYDNEDNLFDYYWCADDYSWVEYTPAWTEEEEQEYADYWNGTDCD